MTAALCKQAVERIARVREVRCTDTAHEPQSTPLPLPLPLPLRVLHDRLACTMSLISTYLWLTLPHMASRLGCAPQAAFWAYALHYTSQ